MYMYQPVAALLNVPSEQSDYLFGIGNQGFKSDMIGVASTWLFYFTFIHALFYIFGNILKYYVAYRWPEAGTNHISAKLARAHIAESEAAFPLYTFVPVLGDTLLKKGYASNCESMEECGGVVRSLLMFGLFVVLLEFIVFFDHWYILHVWKWGKKHLKHDVHHAYEASDEMCVWTGYAFDPLDGFSQGLGLAICQYFIAVPCYFVWALSFCVGVWTMYIHQGVPGLPWPLMGADYHFIHHKYNWYNFGFFTMFWDWVFGTLKHPQSADNWKVPKRD